MPHIKEKIPIDFGGGQRSSEVTRGQRLKTLFTQYLKEGSMDFFHTYLVDALYQGKDSYIFGVGQRSSEVTRGHRMKTLSTQYLKVGSIDLFHTYLVDAPYQGEDPY